MGVEPSGAGSFRSRIRREGGGGGAHSTVASRVELREDVPAHAADLVNISTCVVYAVRCDVGFEGFRAASGLRAPKAA